LQDRNFHLARIVVLDPGRLDLRYECLRTVVLDFLLPRCGFPLLRRLQTRVENFFPRSGMTFNAWQSLLVAASACAHRARRTRMLDHSSSHPGSGLQRASASCCTTAAREPDRRFAPSFFSFLFFACHDCSSVEMSVGYLPMSTQIITKFPTQPDSSCFSTQPLPFMTARSDLQGITRTPGRHAPN